MASVNHVSSCPNRVWQPSAGQPRRRVIHTELDNAWVLSLYKQNKQGYGEVCRITLSIMKMCQTHPQVDLLLDNFKRYEVYHPIDVLTLAIKKYSQFGQIGRAQQREAPADLHAIAEEQRHQRRDEPRNEHVRQRHRQ